MTQTQEPKKDMDDTQTEGHLMSELAPYVCRFCGAPSWHDPSDQSPPPDYCHESDHGEPDHEQEG